MPKRAEKTAMPKRKTCNDATEPAGMHPAYHQMHALLQSIRQLSGHEDELCTLLTELKRTGTPSAAMRREIGTLLDALPLQHLHAEADALSDAVR